MNLRNTMSEMENVMKSFNSRLEKDEERAGELEDI